ncbi:hypothetical protein GCM10027292_26450 [Hydrogenophaga aquatica]
MNGFRCFAKVAQFRNCAEGKQIVDIEVHGGTREIDAYFGSIVKKYAIYLDLYVRHDCVQSAVNANRKQTTASRTIGPSVPRHICQETSNDKSLHPPTLRLCNLEAGRVDGHGFEPSFNRDGAGRQLCGKNG